MDLVVFLLFTENIRIGRAELNLVETVTELLPSLCNFLVDLFFDLAEEILYEDIGTITLLGILVVDERIIESADMTGSLPDPRVHEYAGIDADDVLVESRHGIPPIGFDVVFEFYTHLTVVIDSCQAIINFTGREYETVFLAMGNQYFEQFVLCHDKKIQISFRLQTVLQQLQFAKITNCPERTKPASYLSYSSSTLSLTETQAFAA